MRHERVDHLVGHVFVQRVPLLGAGDLLQPFAEVFKAAGGDFYQIDPLLFSPALIVFRSLRSGRTFRFGEIESDDQIGIVTGLAWTDVGGELLTIRAS